MTHDVFPPLPPKVLADQDKKIGLLHLFSGITKDGEDFFAYVSVKPSCHKEFIEKSAVGVSMSLDRFGEVLFKGWGKGPSNDVKRHMEDLYGLDPDFGTSLQETLASVAGAKEP